MVRLHGIPKNGILRFKADLFSPGGEVFSHGLQSLFVSPRPNSDFQEIPLAGPVAPLGGKWGQATAILIPIEEKLAPPMKSIVALPREKFPPLKEGEFYVCDVVGFEVVDETGRVFGKITGFDNTASARTGASVNLQVKGATAFEFPSTWIEKVGDGQLVVPDVSQWAELDPRQKPDE